MSQIEQKYHAIVIDVEANHEPPNKCFVIRPYEDKDAEIIYSALLKVAKYQDIKLDIVDMKGVSITDYRNKISTNIRQCIVVVAICMPVQVQKKYDYFRGNVMLELGMAYALGKPVLIITNDSKNLPSDLTRDVVLTVNGVKEEILIPNIKDRLNQLLNNTQRELIDPYYSKLEPGIWLAATSHRILLRPSFWDHIQTILTFVDEAENVLEGIKVSIDTMWQDIGNINSYKGEQRDKKRRECVTSWGQFKLLFCQPITELYDKYKLRDETYPVKLACSELINIALNNPQDQGILQDVDTSIDNLTICMKCLTEQFQGISNFEHDFDNYIKTQDPTILPSKILALEAPGKQAIDGCHSLVRNLLQLTRG